MNHLKTFIRLAVIITGVCLLSVIATTYLFYIDEIDQFNDRLVEAAYRVKKSIESMVKYNIEHAKTHGVKAVDLDKYIREQTILQIKRSRGKGERNGEIEIAIAYLKDGRIVWITQSFREEILYSPIPMGHEWAKPMQLALRGGSSVVRGKDYAGEEVLAAYMHVNIINLGVVAKSSIKAIQHRFIEGAVVSMAPAFLAMIVAVVVFWRLISPVLKELEEDIEVQRKLKEDKEKIRKELEESEGRFRCFYEGAFEGIAITSKDKILDVNDQLVKLYKCSREDMIGEDITKFVLEEDHQLVRNHRNAEDPIPYEHRGVRPDGSVVYIEVCGQRATYKGKPVRVTTIHDLTAVKKATGVMQLLNAHQRRVSKLEAIGDFASGIAHDFNNALTPIVGSCDIMLHTMSEDNECRKNVLQILAASETAGLLVHRIQMFTSSDVSTDKLVALRLPGCLREAFDFVRSMTPASVTMSMHIDVGLYAVMASDVTIRQILMNLCKNAAQAMDDKGSITIEACNDEIHVERYGVTKGKYVRLTVEDTGKGMSPETLERALDPYFTTKKIGEGTGIGLSVVNGIVDSYGGLVRLYSEEGRGTRVVIYIPALDMEGKEVKECKIYDPIPMGHGERILLVDDEEMIISTSTAILESLGYAVTAFTSSIAALSEFQENYYEYDVVVTDLTMPEMTGLLLIKEITKLRSDIGIVLCSGLGSNGKYMREVFGNNVGAYIDKPVTRRGYGEVLAKVLGGKNE